MEYLDSRIHRAMLGPYNGEIIRTSGFSGTDIRFQSYGDAYAWATAVGLLGCTFIARPPSDGMLSSPVVVNVTPEGS